MLNKRRRGKSITTPIVPIVAPIIPVAPILVSSLDLEDSNDLDFVSPILTRKVVV